MRFDPSTLNSQPSTFCAPPSSFLIHTFFIVLLALLVPAFFVPIATGGERSVTAAEANGTYRDVEGKSEIKILALGHGKLKVQLARCFGVA